MYKIEFSNNYLSHHGILGQKWGQRNGPPYPLDTSQMSPKERRKIEKAESKHLTNVSKHWLDAYNDATDVANMLLEELNKKYEGNYDSPEYEAAVGAAWVLAYSRVALAVFGPAPITGYEYVKHMPGMKSGVGDLSDVAVDKIIDKVVEEYASLDDNH